MKISTKALDLEIEPELLTDENIERVKKLLELASNYEEAKLRLELASADAGAKTALKLDRKRNRGERA